MNRTINEKKSWRNIFIGFPTIIIFTGVYGFSASENNIILGTLSLCFIFASIFLLCSGFYSLGWEYKRIQVSDALVSGAEQ